jgi:hypothetical protein
VDLQSRDANTRPTLQATVTLPDGRELPLQPLPDATLDTRFHCQFEASQPGAYTVSVAAKLAGRTLADRRSVVEVSSAQGEDPRALPNLSALQRLASGTGGQVVDLSKPETWPTFEQPDKLTIREAKTFDPWSSFTLLLLLVLVLAADWLLRLLRGFV